MEAEAALALALAGARDATRHAHGLGRAWAGLGMAGHGRAGCMGRRRDGVQQRHRRRNLRRETADGPARASHTYRVVGCGLWVRAVITDCCATLGRGVGAVRRWVCLWTWITRSG